MLPGILGVRGSSTTTRERRIRPTPLDWLCRSCPSARATRYHPGAGRIGRGRPRGSLASSRHFWRGVVDGDGSIRIDRGSGIPSLSVVGSPALMRQLAGFLGGCFVDGSPPVPHRHGQSSKVLLVSLRGRRAVAAIQILYADASDALARKRARADRAMAWRPRVMARYPWSRWGNGKRWTSSAAPTTRIGAACGRRAGERPAAAVDASSS